ncbi:MAG TPA: hypothetical protein VJH65_03325 [Candidatus Nanoarchaeia archaeon]|nr:hypothetical protein [Candidatus Nanoarchaeia archaeon]
MVANKEDVKEILRKYGSKIEKQIGTSDIHGIGTSYSNEYMKFKEEMAPEFTRYERWCHSLGSIVKLKPAEKDVEKVKKHIEIAHLDIEPWQALTLGVMVFVSIFLIDVLLSIGIVLIRGFAEFPLLLFFLILTVALFLFYFTNDYPKRLANKWRLKASSQMVPAILYIVVYMRHTANLEKAIAFAAEHLQPPLSLDLRKVFYNVQIGKFSTIKESLDNYLESWRGYSNEFIEAFNLIESSLFEAEESRRIATLEKSMQVVLDGVYDKMLKFTHDVKSPLTNVYMLGVVLPTLGLALLPLASAMLGGSLKVSYVFILFNLIIPFFVFYLNDKILFLRPGGHGETEFLERNPLYSKYKSNAPYINAFLITLPFFILGFLPLIFYYTPLPDAFGLPHDPTFSQLRLGFFGDEKIFDFKETDDGVNGPFGILAVILSLFIPVSIALFFSIAFKAKTKELIIERGKTKDLEREFNSSLFQIGNRLGNGVPPELAFGKVAESSKGLMTEDFFRKVNYNIVQAGMSVEKAIFDPKRGAINYYPSELIATSMRVLIESSKKGLKIAALSLMSISQYIKNIDKITSRLKDMLAEIASDMKSNMTFLAPLLAGIVVSLAVMITSILNSLTLSELAGEGAAGIGGLGDMLRIFEVSNMIPPYYLQMIIGIYLIQIVFILTSTLVGVDSGEDRLEKTNKTGKNLMKGITLYFAVALIATLALFGLAKLVLPAP